jgi:hypothetical protein
LPLHPTRRMILPSSSPRERPDPPLVTTGRDLAQSVSGERATPNSPNNTNPPRISAETATILIAIAGVSLVNAIYNCGRYYPVDTALLERFDKAFNDVGEKAAAREGNHWPTILREEIERRHQEVVATGDKAWCSYQRSIPQNKQFFKRKN